jgi:ArsR family transcriptional regulator
MSSSCDLLELSTPERSKLLGFLKLVSNDNRLQILQLLAAWPERCVCDIWECLGLPQNLTSHHLGLLKDFGLVTARKEGVKVSYQLNHEVMNEYISLLQTAVNRKA